MNSIAVGTRTLSLPSLIPSISSFETQLSPEGALRLQTTLREPVSLVSAFDLVSDTEDRLRSLCREYRKFGVMFLDSGGYETSRVRKYAPYEWTLEKFLATADADLYDFAFSFDIFPCLPVESWSDYFDRLDTLLDQHSIPSTKLIPVVHVTSQDGHHRFSDDHIVQLAEMVAGSHSSPFIAIPERELGAGLRPRVDVARRIVTALKKRTDVRLHILGCGNPLSFAAFTDAGVASCDGLEWCRTYCSSDMRLYHFQHSETVGGLLEPVSEQAQLLLEYGDYYLKTAVTNLNNFAAIVRDVQDRSGSALEIISKSFGQTVNI